ncbi:hypothetical protein DMUE_1436 [Dictyocoela muelleri]|nr:hypothetical protein DMUE_1436 [Dictyocoela muelleri]
MREEILREVFNKQKIKRMFKGSKFENIQEIASFSLIDNKKRCSCENEMVLIKKSKLLDGFVWVCCTGSHRKELSVIRFFYEEFTKSFEDILLFLFFWCKDDGQKSIGKYLRINKNTLSLWCLNCRAVCQEILFGCDIRLVG